MDKSIEVANKISGTIQAPPSKAHTLRAIIIASLAQGKSILNNCLIAEDQEYAIKAMRQLGAKIDYDLETRIIKIEGVNGKPIAPKEDIFIGNSGLTVRLLVPILGLSQGKEVIIDGVERMRTARPIQDLLDALSPLGMEVESINGNGCPPIKAKCNSLDGGVTEMKGDKSSQYFSAIMISAPYAKKDVTIKTIGKLISKPFLDITFSSMKEFGVIVKNNNYESFEIDSGQKYIGREIDMEGDYSSSAYFFGACAIMGGKIKVTNLQKSSVQGEKYFLDLMQKMGCKVVYNADDSVDFESGKLIGLGDVDMSDYPDIVMPLAVVAANAVGKTKITNIEHLRIKESDRITATVDSLKKIGAGAEGGNDYILIKGNEQNNFHGGDIDSYNDHRIVMSFAIAGLKIPGIKIIGAEAVGKSFPNFFEEIEKIVVR